jgi:UPF0755 protein
MKRLIISYAVLIAVLALVFWLVGAFFTPQGPAAASVQFTVSPGDGVFSISRNLTKQEILRSSLLFLIYSIFSGHYYKFKPGTYLLKQPLGISDIVKVITSGPTEISVTIIPGMTLKEVDDVLSKNGVIKSGSLISLEPSQFASEYPFLDKSASLEGFLLPDTYRFWLSMKPKDAANIMLNNFYKKAWTQLSFSVNPYKTLIIASLLEKEVVSKYDKQMVAGIINNRLKIGMPLQIDATVVYAACGGEFLNCEPLSSSDFSIKSPYNTYKIVGLPPTPIGSPTLDSIQAAQSPIASSYLFYLSDSKTQKTIFSKTLQDHAINRQKYLGL